MMKIARSLFGFEKGAPCPINLLDRYGNETGITDPTIRAKWSPIPRRLSSHWIGATFAGHAMNTQVISPDTHKRREFQDVQRMSWCAIKTPSGIGEIAKQVGANADIPLVSCWFIPAIPKGTRMNTDTKRSNIWNKLHAMTSSGNKLRVAHTKNNCNVHNLNSRWVYF